MNYTLHQLQVFLKTTQTKSITKAAEELHLTQPAVSIQLKNFQSQFDIPLMEIVGRRIHVTDFGHEIAHAAEKIINEVHAINYKTLSHKGLLAGKLKISIVSTGKYVMPYFLSNFMKENEGIELIMDVTNRSKVIENIENNEVDFALISLMPERLKIERLELMNNKLFLIGKANGSLNKNHYPNSILEEYPLIYRESGSGTRHMMENYLTQHKIIVKKKIQLTSNEAVKQAVLAGLGYSIMPLIGIKNEITNGDLDIIPIEGLPLITNWNLVWPQRKKFSPVANTFLQHLQEEKENIIAKSFAWYEQF